MKVIKVFHLFFLILWLGSLSVLPYLIRQKWSACFHFYKKYELPCMILAIITGATLLVINPEKLKVGAFHLKLTCALFLVALDVWTGRQAYLYHSKGMLKSKRLLYATQLLTYFLIICTLFAIFAWQK